MSINNPFTCGYAKIGVYNLLSETILDRYESERDIDYRHRVRENQFSKYNTYFETEKYENLRVPYKNFQQSFPGIVKTLTDLGKRHSTTKKELLQLFSQTNWSQIKEEVKAKHSLKYCEQCMQQPELKRGLAKIPIKNTVHKRKAIKEGLFQEKTIQDVTKCIVKNLDKNFKEAFSTTFSREFSKNNPSSSSENIDVRQLGRSIRNNIQQIYADTVVER